MFKWNANSSSKPVKVTGTLPLNLTYVLWQKRGICNDKYTQEVTMNIQVKMLFAFKLLFDKGSLFFIIPSQQKRNTTFAYYPVQKLTKKSWLENSSNNIFILPFVLPDH